MGLRIESHAEPIPGYRLIERLGGGGFGEVWKAEAPGGLFKAIKFVYGQLAPKDNDKENDGISLGGADEEDASRAEQEFKALNRVKSVHHPFILSLEQFHVIDGQLVIVMELADRTLWDRFRECRQQGLPGIPRDELLQYLLETAEALDLMNSHYQLQHLDIKPQNLFLVFNHVKVADFGLVKDLEGMHATVTGGVTPVYAAPETFDGWISRFSDQYSLGIVYQELLTGQRPFTGTTIRQLVMQHLQGRPNLSSLLLAEQPIIARALSKNPEHRFPTCTEFVQKLKAAVVNHGNVVPAVLPMPPEEAASPPVARGLDNRPALPGQELPGALTDESGFATENARGCWQRSKTPEPAAPAVPVPSVLPPRPAKKSAVRKREASTAQEAISTPSRHDSGPAKITPLVPQKRTETSPPVAAERGVLRPSLVIGLGRMGLTVLKHLRKELNDQFGHPDTLPHLRLLHIDTDPESAQLAAQGKSDQLLPGETLLTRLQRPGHYLKAHAHESWLDSRVLYRIPRSRNHAGVRPLGRLAFVENYRAITTRLEACLAALAAPESMQQALQNTGLGQHSGVPRVYIVTSLMGGTGSGMFLDLAYLVRRLLREQGVEQAEIMGLFFVPRADKTAAQTAALANTYAAYSELTHFSARETTFSVRYEGNKRYDERSAPFEHCLLLPLPEARSNETAAQVEESLARAGHFLCVDVSTPVGPALEEARRQADSAADFGNPVGYHTFGNYRIVWPRRQILGQIAHRLCTRLAQHWMSKEAAHVQQEIRDWAREQWEGQGFRPENLIARQQEHCATVLEQAPENLFATIVDPVAQALAGARAGEANLQLAPVVQAVDSLEKLLGLPEYEHSQAGSGVNAPELSPIEKATQQAARTLAAECEQKLSELVVLLFEEPRYRLAGAEELIRQLSACVQQALESQESLCRELEERTVTVHQRLHMLMEGGASPAAHTTPRWKSPFGRRSPAQGPSGPEMLELLRTFAKCRYQSIMLQYINGLYVRLRGYLSDQMREIGFCRTRLLELKDLLRGRSSAVEAVPLGDQVLLPAGCKNVEAVVKQLDAGVSADELLDFDKQVQLLVAKQYHGLVEVCMAPSSVVAALAPVLVQEAERFLEPLLEGNNIAEMYLARYAEDEEGKARLEADLLTAFDEAVPDLGSVPPDREVCLVAIPAGEAGDRLRDLVAEFLPRAQVVTSRSSDELLLLRAYQRLDPAETEQFGPAAQEAYQARLTQDACSVHTRTDIAAWRQEDAAVS